MKDQSHSTPLLKSSRSADKQLKIKALILPVSTPWPAPTAKDVAPDGTTSLTIPGFVAGQTHRVGGRALRDEDEAINEFARRINRDKPPGARDWYWNWHQLLRSLRDHDDLQQLWLIGSNGKRGSHQACSEFCYPWIRSYVPSACRDHVHVFNQGIDFENYNEIESSLRSLIFGPLKNYDHRHIAVDVTGGQKPTSIAAAALTMNRELVFQYVQTNPDYATLIFDVALDDAHVHGGLES